jgi:hypothetical protein
VPTPEVNLARRLIERQNLTPPVDVESLVKKYADLIFKPIPINGVDGVSLNLKALNRKARVIVNSNNPPRRIRFTLAHELGHILIPWHIGSIVDSIDLPTISDNELEASLNTWNLEKEANSFAAELLMPIGWIIQLLDDVDDLAKAHKRIVTVCDVSPLAAGLRLTGFLPPNVVYACESYGLIEFSGKSEGTFASTLPWGSNLPDSPYGYAECHYSATLDGKMLHWWKLPARVDTSSGDPRPWREILSEILSELASSPEASEKMRQSINGVASYAHSAAKKQPGYSRETVMAACLQKFCDRPQYTEFVSHKLFSSFLSRRTEAFFHSNDSQ